MKLALVLSAVCFHKRKTMVVVQSNYAYQNSCSFLLSKTFLSNIFWLSNCMKLATGRDKYGGGPDIASTTMTATSTQINLLTKPRYSDQFKWLTRCYSSIGDQRTLWCIWPSDQSTPLYASAPHAILKSGGPFSSLSILGVFVVCLISGLSKTNQNHVWPVFALEGAIYGLHLGKIS